jgi:LAS superfamily LD-carboxypeptidase LdcB
MPNLYSKDFQSKSNFKIISSNANGKISVRSKFFFGLALTALVLSFVVFVNNLISFAVFTSPVKISETNNNSTPQIIQLTQAFQNPIGTSSPKISVTISSNQDKVTEIINNSQATSSIQSTEAAKEETKQKDSIFSTISSSSPSPAKIELTVMSGADFQNIYESTQYQNVGGTIIPSITDNVDVDNYIRKLGIARGYKLRPQAIESNLVSVDGFLLQPEAANSWTQLKQRASDEGVNLVLTSGYRSIASQRSIFASDLAPEYQITDILNGTVDGPLQAVLNRASIPGYSRHHTGYTIDVGCIGEGSVFGNTSCYRWMKNNNFAQARLAGYIPSYPEGANQQGPNPEEWEFVWVGQK